LVAQLHKRGEAIRHAEIERFAARLASLDDAQLAAVQAVTRGIVAKLLHKPSVKLKDDAGTPQGERNAAAVRDLFDLG
jgi:glutamyl-tRNA reductase